MTSSTTTSASTRDWVLIFILALIWGGSFLFGRILMLEWPPFTVVFLRVFIAAIALWGFIAITRGKVSIPLHLVSALVVMAILNNVIPFSLILIGQQEIGSGLASVVNAMTPIWTLIIANFFTVDEKFTRLKLAGIICGFIGVAVLIGADLVQGLSASAWAQAAILGATISYGFATVWGKRFKGTDPIIIATGQLTASSLIILPIVFLIEDPLNLSAPTMEMIISVLGLSVLCSAIAYILFFKILESAGATNLSLVTFVIPPSAIFFGFLFLGETLDYEDVIGVLMIAAGLALIDGRIAKLGGNKKTS